MSYKKMLQYNRIDVWEGTDINKTSEPKEGKLCHYWYFKDVGYKFQPYFCNGCHAVSVVPYELKNISILKTKGVDYRCILWSINKNDAIDRLSNSVLEDKGILLKDFGVMLVVNRQDFIALELWIRSNNRKVKKLIQRLVRRRKRQD